VVANFDISAVIAVEWRFDMDVHARLAQNGTQQLLLLCGIVRRTIIESSAKLIFYTVTDKQKWYN